MAKRTGEKALMLKVDGVVVIGLAAEKVLFGRALNACSSKYGYEGGSIKARQLVEQFKRNNGITV